MPIFEVRHQSAAQSILQRAIAGKRVPHAYIFHGPEGVGKEMLANRWAKLLLCANHREVVNPPREYAGLHREWVDSCGDCRSCTLAHAGTHPDCHVVHRHLIKFHPDANVRNRKAAELSIDVIRQFVIEAAGKKPAMGSAKIFVLRECETLSQHAQHALLKTLEEPPPGTYLLLLTTSLDKMLPTARSRCQSVPFHPLPPAFVAERLSELRADAGEEQIHYLARHEPGSLGQALELLDDGAYQYNQTLLDSLVHMQRTDSLQFASRLEELGKEMGRAIQQRAQAALRSEPADRGDRKHGQKTGASKESGGTLSESVAVRQALGRLLAMVATVFRDVLNLSCDAQVPICNVGADNALRSLGERLGAPRARQAIKAVADTEYQLKLNANTRLCLDSLAIQLARLSDN